MLKLHYAPGTIAVAAAITLEEAGLAHELVPVDFASAAQTKPAYHRINPKGRVPALETPDGILTETGAILEYINAVSGKGLVPAHAFEAAKMREVMFYLASTMHVNHAHKMRGARWADKSESWEDMKAKVTQTMTESCAYLMGNFAFAPFVTGQNMTLADPYTFVVVNWAAGDGVDMAQFPELAAFVDMMRRRPAVQAVAAKGLI